MSNTETPTPLDLVHNESMETEEKQSFFQRRVVAPIKKHPKLSIAVAAGVTLVTAAALAGRSTDSNVPTDPFAPELVAAEEPEEDTTVA